MTATSSLEERNKKLLEASDKFARGEISREEYEDAERLYGFDIVKILMAMRQRRKAPKRQDPDTHSS